MGNARRTDGARAAAAAAAVQFVVYRRPPVRPTWSDLSAAAAAAH